MGHHLKGVGAVTVLKVQRHKMDGQRWNFYMAKLTPRAPGYDPHGLNYFIADQHASGKPDSEVAWAKSRAGLAKAWKRGIKNLKMGREVEAVRTGPREEGIKMNPLTIEGGGRPLTISSDERVILRPSHEAEEIPPMDDIGSEEVGGEDVEKAEAAPPMTAAEMHYRQGNPLPGKFMYRWSGVATLYRTVEDFRNNEPMATVPVEVTTPSKTEQDAHSDLLFHAMRAAEHYGAVVRTPEGYAAFKVGEVRLVESGKNIRGNPISIPTPREAYDKFKEKGLKRHLREGYREAKELWRGAEGNPPRHGRKLGDVELMEKRKIEIAIQTLRMPPAMAGVMGGPSIEESHEILREYGYTDAQIAAMVSGRKANPRTVPTTDEMLDMAVGYAEVMLDYPGEFDGGKIRLYLVEQYSPRMRRTYFSWCEDDGDPVGIDGATIDQAIDRLKRTKFSKFEFYSLYGHHKGKSFPHGGRYIRPKGYDPRGNAPSIPARPPEVVSYNYFVIDLSKDPIEIESGWENQSDAQDRVNEMNEETEQGGSVKTRRGLGDERGQAMLSVFLKRNNLKLEG